MMEPSELDEFPSLSVSSGVRSNGGRSNGSSSCQCPPHLLLSANKNAVSHSSHCPEFRCSLCLTSFSSNFVLSHAESATHRGKFRIFREALFLLSLPEPGDEVLEVVSQALISHAKKKALDDESLKTIRDTIENLNHMIAQEVSDRASLRLFGSVLMGTAICRRSDVNLDLVIHPRERNENSGMNDSLEQDGEAAQEEEEANPLQILSRIAELLQRNPEKFQSVSKDFTITCPRVRFTITDPNSPGKSFNPGKVRCFEILLSGQRTVQTSTLLQKYVQMDERFRILAICVRIWSSKCILDEQESGTWPPHAFTLLLIAFLQRMKPHPVLPFLQPPARQSAAATASPGQDVSPEAATQPEEDPADTEIESDADWVSENTDSVGQLWVAFLRHYAITFRAGVEVVSIRKDPPSGPLKHRDKGWGTKILAIEEPFRPWLNLSRSVGSREIFANFLHLIRQTYVHFVTPQLKEGPAFKANNFEMTFKQPIMSEGSEDESGHNQSSSMEEEEEEDGLEDDEEGGENYDDGLPEDSARQFRVAALISRRHGICLQLSPDVMSSLKKLDPRKLKFRFNFSSQEWFRSTKKFCHSCRKSGHTANACPAESLPQSVELPPAFPAEVLLFHSQIYQNLYEEERITPDQEKEHEFVMSDLLDLIRDRLLPDAEMQLFGSCVNGFGSCSSDLDLCLTLRSDPTGKSLDANRLGKMIHDIATVLHGHPPVLKSSILPIVHAKVPIVKFTYLLCQKGRPRREIQCDVSLYNVLGCSNTRLLRAYCDLDPRVPVLGFVVKHLAKTCDIADASRGSLSSYAYCLMTLHFLQELGWNGNKKPEVLVDGCNAYFCEDLRKVRELWKANPSTEGLYVADLFIRFLKYYTEEFSFADYVVCCRRTANLTRLEKMWTGKRIAIEDPFLLTHNLGAGLGPQMATFIQSSLVLARNHFGMALAYSKPPQFGSVPASIPVHLMHNEIAYLFNRKLLTTGSLPTGRGCRLCGRIAHKVKDCPMRPQQRRDGMQRRQNFSRPADHPHTCFGCGSPNHKVNACPHVGPRGQQQQYHRPGQWNNTGPRPEMMGRAMTAIHRAPMPRQMPVPPFPMRPPPRMSHNMHDHRKQQQQPPPQPAFPPPGRADAGTSFRRISFQQLAQQQQQHPLPPVPTAPGHKVAASQPHSKSDKVSSNVKRNAGPNAGTAANKQGNRKQSGGGKRQ